jgi:hypothetical protein
LFSITPCKEYTLIPYSLSVQIEDLFAEQQLKLLKNSNNFIPSPYFAILSSGLISDYYILFIPSLFASTTLLLNWLEMG